MVSKLCSRLCNVVWRGSTVNGTLIVRGGMTEAVGSGAALRLAAPLVGAGLDRVAHAALVSGLSPLELAARARVRLETLRPPSTAGGSGVIDLLE